MAAPIFQPDFSGVMSAEIAALTPVLSNAVQSGFASYKPVALTSGIMKEAPVDDSNRLILVAADRPQLIRLWTGERVEQPIVVNSMDITPMPYESTISIDKFQYQDASRIAYVYGGVFENWGMQMNAFSDVLAANAFAALTSTEGYDGVNVCSTSHPIDPENPNSGTWSNNFVETPLTTENLASAYASFQQIPGRDGLPWSNRGPGTVKLVVPPQLAFAAEQATAEMIGRIIYPDTGSSPVGAAPESNVRLSRLGIEVVTLQTLSDQTSWFLCDTKTAAYPTLVWGMREPFFITPMVAPTSPNVFNQHKFMWGLEGRQAVGFSLPQNVLRCTSSSS